MPTAATLTDRPATAAAARLVLLDGIRGYLLVAMYVAHFCIEMLEIGLYSWGNYTRHSRWLPVGDIEFFLPLSGFVVALSYVGVHSRNGQRGLWQTVGRRLRWVYGYQVAATLALVLLVAAGLAGIDLRQPAGQPLWALVLKSFSLVVMPENLDILVLNLVLLPLVPPAFALLAGGRVGAFWAAVALAALVARLGLDQRLSAMIVAAGFDWRQWFGVMGHFNPLSYGVLFFAGLALGYRYKTDRRWFETGAGRPRAGAALAAVALLAGYALAYRHFRHGGPFGGGNILLSVHALLVTAAAYYLLFWLLATRALPRLARAVSAFLALPPLLLLGRNSLFVYALHVVVVALAKAAIIAVQAAGVVPGQAMMLAVLGFGLLVMLGATALKNRYLPWTS